MNKCTECDQVLTAEEQEYMVKALQTLKDNGICEGEICRLHYCECMPASTPWSYLSKCVMCGENICKSCSAGVYGGRSCMTCHDKVFP